MLRRGFAKSVMGGAGLMGLGHLIDPSVAEAERVGSDESMLWLPSHARTHRVRTRKQSSADPTGGNDDRWHIAAGESRDIFVATGAGAITHIWFTISDEDPLHLKEIVLRAYWDGHEQPSIEVPIGDFFGLNVAHYGNFQSAFITCSPGKSLNAFFAMPYRKRARLTVTNEGAGKIRSFYSNIDYVEVDHMPDDALYFHAQYRQATPNVAQQLPGEKNLDGKDNYVFVETHGQGHLLGVSLGVIQNADGWMGEGDDMTFIDDPAMPIINGTGTEDYFLGSWNFFGRPFAHQLYGAPLIENPEKTGGQYCCYRFHGDNPIVFTKYLKHTIEHGTANNRADNFYSCAYWYQAQPSTEFPPLPALADRIKGITVQGQ